MKQTRVISIAGVMPTHLRVPPVEYVPSNEDEPAQISWSAWSWKDSPALDGSGRSRRKTASGNLLEDFLDLADATDDEIADFASEWGPLGFCRRHRVPHLMTLGCDYFGVSDRTWADSRARRLWARRPMPEITTEESFGYWGRLTPEEWASYVPRNEWRVRYWEPIAAWRVFAARLRAILRLLVSIAKPKPSPNGSTADDLRLLIDTLDRGRTVVKVDSRPIEESFFDVAHLVRRLPSETPVEIGPMVSEEFDRLLADAGLSATTRWTKAGPTLLFTAPQFTRADASTLPAGIGTDDRIRSALSPRAEREINPYAGDYKNPAFWLTDRLYYATTARMGSDAPDLGLFPAIMLLAAKRIFGDPRGSYCELCFADLVDEQGQPVNAAHKAGRKRQYCPRCDRAMNNLSSSESRQRNWSSRHRY